MSSTESEFEPTALETLTEEERIKLHAYCERRQLELYRTIRDWKVTLPNGDYRAQALYRLAGALELVKTDLQREEATDAAQTH